MNAFTRDFFAVFFAESLRITFFGYLEIPATRQWPYGRSRVPSSNCLMITAFRPAKRPLRTTTALLGFRNFILGCCMSL
ncbi:hypothetical protein Hanom_Chr07g00667901 [Helianthus anomalus]